MKFCKKCNKIKDFKDFFIIRYNQNGTPLYRAKCTECFNVYYVNKHRSKSLEERKKKYQQRKSKTTFLSRKENRLKRNFGISLDEYNIMIYNQNNSCYICKTKFLKNSKVNVDHNHKTGKIRKLLCQPCNTSLGLLRENINILNSCISYLKEHNDTISDD